LLLVFATHISVLIRTPGLSSDAQQAFFRSL
jgi:hypothetical protein